VQRVRGEDGIVGADLLVPKSSAVDAAGALTQRRIEGVRFRPTRPVAHEDGVVTEVARTAWEEIDAPIVHVHVTTTLPGRTRAWGLHRTSTDRLFVVSGLVSIVVFDGRADSPTSGVTNEFRVSERIPGILVIPPDLYHGWHNLGTDEAYLLNMPTMSYDHDRPDALDLPYESPQAFEIVPFRW
jgi:dTDP-4-dehydrorhamnose 3,5-epimerase